MFSIFKNKTITKSTTQSYIQSPTSPVWSKRNYTKFADEAYSRNVIAHRAIKMIASGAASLNLHIENITIRSLMSRPNPFEGGNNFLEKLFIYRLISGNAYIQGISAEGEIPQELYLLRPDRINIMVGKGGRPVAYRYKIGNKYTDFNINHINGISRILHLKDFHPTDDFYGLSPIEAAAYSIDQHNQAAAWNQSLLQNGARPTGALIVKTDSDGGGNLSEDQYWRIKSQIDEQFSGSENAGRPLLLEGGLEWKEMSLSPKDMDFIEMKNSAARDIALAFGMPPQLLGIQGDATYSNLAEARKALWLQTIIPLAKSTMNEFSGWFSVLFGEDISIEIDANGVKF